MEFFWLRAGILAFFMFVPSVAVGLFDPRMPVKKWATIFVPIIFATIAKFSFMPTSSDWFGLVTSTIILWAIGFFLFIFLVNVGMVIRSELANEVDRMRA
ncbi:MAG: hypothetical protein AAB780_00790 [Patescibacteria group bacterium]